MRMRPARPEANPGQSPIHQAVRGALSQSNERLEKDMNANLKAKWIEALCSGEIKQTDGLLIDSRGRMCCLGVLERVAGTDEDDIRAHRAEVVVGDNWRGLGNKRRQALAALNDAGVPFEMIAGFIHENL